MAVAWSNSDNISHDIIHVTTDHAFSLPTVCTFAVAHLASQYLLLYMCFSHSTRAALTIIIISDIDGHNGDPSKAITALHYKTELEVFCVFYSVVINDED